MAKEMRISREQLHMITAMMWAERSVCKRNKVGVVITTADMRQVISFGYNGPARQLPHERCRAVEGACGCIHAETNALVMARQCLEGCTIFTTVSPCLNCAQLIIQAGITQVMYMEPYRDCEEAMSIMHYSHLTLLQISKLDIRQIFKELSLSLIPRLRA